MQALKIVNKAYYPSGGIWERNQRVNEEMIMQKEGERKAFKAGPCTKKPVGWHENTHKLGFKWPFGRLSMLHYDKSPPGGAQHWANFVALKFYVGAQGMLLWLWLCARMAPGENTAASGLNWSAFYNWAILPYFSNSGSTIETFLLFYRIK